MYSHSCVWCNRGWSDRIQLPFQSVCPECLSKLDTNNISSEKIFANARAAGGSAYRGGLTNGG